MTQPTLSPRTLGMYWGCELNDFAVSARFAPLNLHYYEKYGVRPEIKLVLKRPSIDIKDKIHIMAVDGIRRNGVDLGGFILQNGTETWVPSLIDAGVAVEMEVGNG